MQKKVHIIGSGFSSLSAACYLANDGFDVTVLEKNDRIGGRARQLKRDGFTFDMGPTWYWMPDIFEKFFGDFKHQPSDYYVLDKLNPGYQVYFAPHDSMHISGNLDEIFEAFEKEEKGSSQHLLAFLESAKKNYAVAVEKMVYKPGLSPFELISKETVGKLNQLFQTIRQQVRKNITNPKLIKVLEFPVLFLGAKPDNTPGLYNFMNWADFGLGTWHPKGGMFKVVEGIQKMAESMNVKFHLNANVEELPVKDGKINHILVNGEKIETDIVLSGADYHHTETLLDKPWRQYSENYWDKRIFAPSSLLFYIGFNKKLKNIAHHTLFFDTEFDVHAADIYDDPKWPNDPLFYASFPSQTDNSFAPEGKEAATFLIPLAPDLEDTETLRKKYLDIIITRLEKLTGQKLKDDMLFVESYCVNDFKEDYNSYKGNAYGLANILTQTAFLRPNLKSSKVNNLFFTGQLTVPGPGVPPSLISGKIVSGLIKNQFI